MLEAEGIPPTASVASTGLGLRYIGKDHCYAFSGAVSASTSEQTLFDFTSGAGYIVATLTMTAPIKMTTLTPGYIRGFQLNFNSQTVGLYKADAENEDMPTIIEAQILIPSLTAVVLTCQDHGTEANYLGTANLTGRVYGAD